VFFGPTLQFELDSYESPALTAELQARKHIFRNAFVEQSGKQIPDSPRTQDRKALNAKQLPLPSNLRNIRSRNTDAQSCVRQGYRGGSIFIAVQDGQSGIAGTDYFR